jgi:AP-1 complex subunit gamma-1
MMFFEALQMPGAMRLKDLIRAVRACKTASDERAVIAKESANIRTAFKEENTDVRHRCVAKLLYIQMLGYPAHFGQMECLKLIASPKFVDKKLGYLGVMLLLDENQEVLTLITNCLKNDMNHPNMYIVGMALSALGNIGSSEVARDLANEVDKLLSSSNPYIRKKAGLCAIRVIKRVPDFADIFFPRIKAMMNDKNHSVLLTAITLSIQMCQVNPEMIVPMRKVRRKLSRYPIL